MTQVFVETAGFISLPKRQYATFASTAIPKSSLTFHLAYDRVQVLGHTGVVLLVSPHLCSYLSTAGLCLFRGRFAGNFTSSHGLLAGVEPVACSHIKLSLFHVPSRQWPTASPSKGTARRWCQIGDCGVRWVHPRDAIHAVYYRESCRPCQLTYRVHVWR